MSGIQQLLLGGSPAGGYQIERSLRFNSADSAYLNRTPASASNRKTWTWSAWVKRSKISDTNIQTLLSTASNVDLIGFNADDTFRVWTNTNTNNIATTQVFRDVSAWYHIVVAMDTTQATASNRLKIYLNGSQITAVSGTYPTQNYDTSVNNTVQHRIGYTVSGDYNYFSGYLTEVNFIDGQALTPSSFGQSNPNTGVWEPIRYTGTYGTNGFYLNFSDNSNTTATTLGKDSSGNGNNWTPNGFSVTAGAGNDSLVDTPTSYGTDTGAGGEVRGNYATLNPLILIPRGTISNGNLNYLSGSTASHGSAAASFTLPTTGKWYWEVTACNNSGGSGNNEAIGIANIQNNPQLPAAGSEVGSRTGDYIYRSSGVRISGGSSVSYGATYTNGDVIGVAWDSDAGTLVFYKNGVSQGTAYSSITQVEGRFAPASSNAETSNGDNYNFGQRPFAYTAPSGFKALCTQNLPTPTIGATSTTQANRYFDIQLYTGTGSSRSVTGYNFQPDFLWIKGRSGATDHGLYDAVRGVQKQIESNTTTAETTETTGLTAFNSDGFTVGALAQLNTNTATYVAWCWKANGAGSTNTAGTITSTVSVDTTSGCSVLTYNPNNTSGTIGHGLGIAPQFIIVRSRTNSGGDPWGVYHVSLGNTKYLRLNTTDAEATLSTVWNNTSPTSTVVSIGTSDIVSSADTSFIMYCFAPIAGYSAFGSYTGNGSTDGPFIYTGFRPRWLLIKNSSRAVAWWIVDTARNTSNVVGWILQPNVSTADVDSPVLDILSNGFKVRTTDQAANFSGETIIYAAFCESPFKYSLAR